VITGPHRGRQQQTGSSLGFGPGRARKAAVEYCSSNRTGEIPPSGMIAGPGGIVARLVDPLLAGAPPGYPTDISPILAADGPAPLLDHTDEMGAERCRTPHGSSLEAIDRGGQSCPCHSRRLAGTPPSYSTHTYRCRRSARTLAVDGDPGAIGIQHQAPGASIAPSGHLQRRNFYPGARILELAQCLAFRVGIDDHQIKFTERGQPVERDLTQLGVVDKQNAATC
jgi:hypothetical protein